MKVPLLERWLQPTMASSLELVEQRSAESGHLWEWALIFASVGVAFLGWFIARTFYKDARSRIPGKLTARFPRLHRVVYHKYYVDELYEATVLRPVILMSRALAAFDASVIDGTVNGVARAVRFFCDIQGAVDKYLVDGAVNFVADGVIQAGNRLRRMQTGRIQTYLYAAVAGALVVIGINYLIR
jgi:NADH-quinone oxidoreductase subunit L